MSIDLAAQLLDVFPGLAIKIALARLSTILAQRQDLVDPVIKTTSSRFQEVEGAETALNSWTATEAFTEFFERAYAGERDFGSEIVKSFINDGDFYLANDADRFTVAEKIVGAFLAELAAAILRSDDGLAAHGNRQEVLHIETRDDISRRVEARLADFESKLPSILATATAQVEPESLPDPAHRELATKIDFARDLINQGLVSSARVALDRLKAETREITDELEFRLITNLGICALAEDDIDGACALIEEAYRIQPEDRQAVTNAAAAAHLRKDSKRAVALAHKARGLDHQNSQATAILMREFWDMAQIEQFEVLVGTEEWITGDRECGLVLAWVRVQQSCLKEAVTICRSLTEAYSESALVHLALSQCLIGKAEADRRHPTGDEDETLAGLCEAEAEATRAIDLLEPTELNAPRQESLIARAGARMLLGSTAQAICDLDKVLSEAPARSDAVFNKALILVNEDRPEEARGLLERIPRPARSADASLLLGEACFLSGDAAAVAELFSDILVPDHPGWWDIRSAEILSRAEAALAGEDSVGPALEKARTLHPNDPRLLTLAAIRSDLSDDSDRAEELLLRALDHAGDTDRREILIQLGLLYQRLQRFAEAANRFSEALDGVASHPAAKALLICLFNDNRLRDALSWVRKIRKMHRQPPRLAIEIEAQILEYLGDIPAAISCLDELCSRTDATTVDQVKLSVAQFRRGERDAARRTVDRITASQLSDDPQAILQLAQLKLLLGMKEYLDDAYLARRCGINDPNAHLGYFGIFHSREKQGWTEPEIVGPGCAVLLHDESTEQWWQVLENGEKPQGRYEIAPSQDLARRLLGRGVGETIVLREGLEELSYEIAAIQSKYVRAYQETLEEFSTRFPGNMGLSRIKIENDDITKILYTVDQRYQLAREVERMYRQRQIPLASFASMLGRSVLEAWHACTAGDFNGIRFGIGTEEEANMASELLREADGIVLDLPALLTMHELGLTPHLQSRFRHVVVPQHVVDEIQEVYAKTAMGPISGNMGKGSDGRYILTEMSEDDWAQWQESVRSILDFAETFERVASYGILDADNIDQLADAMTWAGVAAVYSGDKKSPDQPVLVSDDLGLAAVARSIGRNAVNTQAILQELRRSQVITDEQYSAWVERMVLLNYHFVRLEHEDIVRRLEANSYITTDGTRAMLTTLEGPECSEDSAVSVAAEVIFALVGRASARQTELILSALLATLSQGRVKIHVLQSVKREIARKFNLHPFMRDQLVRTVDTYINLN